MYSNIREKGGITMNITIEDAEYLYEKWGMATIYHNGQISFIENGKEDRYEIFIQRPDEEFEYIDTVNDLELAKKIARNVPTEWYRAIGIHKLDSNGNYLGNIEI